MNRRGTDMEQDQAQGELDFRREPSERDHPFFSMLDERVVAAFWSFHERHPNVYGLFKRYALDAKRAGRSKFGIGMIAERVRWYMSVESVGTADEDFKINNNLRSCYARLLMIREPEALGGLFELRSSQPTTGE